MDRNIALVQSRTFWAALLALISIVAQTFGWAQALAIASDPHTVDAIMTLTSTLLTLAAVVFARLPQGKITSVLPPDANKGGTTAALIGALLLLPLLGGCNGSQPGAAVLRPVTQGQVDALRAAYDAAVLTPAAAYRNLGFCAAGTAWTAAKPCADPTIVARLRAADAAFANAIGLAQSLVASRGAGLPNAYALAQQALTAAEGLASALPNATSAAK